MKWATLLASTTSRRVPTETAMSRCTTATWSKSTWPGNFAINMQNQQLLTAYDYRLGNAVSAFVDSSNGGPVIETIPPGIPLAGTEGVPGAGNQDYSAGDKEGILRLYGHAPTTVTITSNPIGLQVIVDNTTYTTPRTFSWTMNSTHSLSVANGVQTLTGDIENSTQSTTFYYTYGRGATRASRVIR